MGKPPELDENLRSALWIKEGPLGDEEVNGLESSFFSSSLSFGEKAAPNGLWSRGPVAFGLAGLPFRLDCDGGVDPEENLELKLDIHEFLRPESGLGAVFGVAGEDVDGLCSTGFSGSGIGSSSLIASFCGSCFVVEPLEDGGRAGLLFDRVRRCVLDGFVAESFSALDLSLPPEVTDFVRER